MDDRIYRPGMRVIGFGGFLGLMVIVIAPDGTRSATK